VGQTRFFRRIFQIGSSRTIEAIVEASIQLTVNKWGALIVIQRETGLRTYKDAGTELKAEVTAPLLMSIFNPGSPLHDGAVIIQNDIIDAAACILPLTESTMVDPGMGTRHRAALGISEETDSIVLVISEETAKVIKDGWLYTGDIGEIDPQDGYLRITDRKKDIIVSAGGDNISPAKIENQLTNSPAIEQSMVYGDRKNYLVALIVPSKEFSDQKEKINEIVNEINNNLTLVEKIKKFHLIDESFSIENGLLTPTMKVKRNKVTAKYKNILENFYKK